jgi:hypothetical protein
MATGASYDVRRWYGRKQHLEVGNQITASLHRAQRQSLIDASAQIVIGICSI